MGGPKFATILSLAYRQAYSSTKLTWNSEKKIHWQFLKEISTGSDLSTMDVIYPGPHPTFLQYQVDCSALACYCSSGRLLGDGLLGIRPDIQQNEGGSQELFSLSGLGDAGSPLYIYQAPDLAYNLLISTLEYANNATNISYNLAWCPHVSELHSFQCCS